MPSDDRSSNASLVVRVAMRSSARAQPTVDVSILEAVLQCLMPVDEGATQLPTASRGVDIRMLTQQLPEHHRDFRRQVRPRQSAGPGATKRMVIGVRPTSENRGYQRCLRRDLAEL